LFVDTYSTAVGADRYAHTSFALFSVLLQSQPSYCLIVYSLRSFLPSQRSYGAHNRRMAEAVHFPCFGLRLSRHAYGRPERRARRPHHHPCVCTGTPPGPAAAPFAPAPDAGRRLLPP
jgi:hypothetical protein